MDVVPVSSSSRVGIQVAGPADLPVIQRVVNDAYRTEPFFTDTERVSREELVDLISSGAFMVVVDSRTAVIGAVHVRTDGSRGCLSLIAVAPDCRRAGVGRLLLRAAEQHLRQGGCARSRIEVPHVCGDLLSFCLHLGYRVTKTAPFDRVPRPERSCYLVLMEKDISR